MNILYKKSRLLAGSILAASTVLTSFSAQAALEGFEVSDEIFAVKGTSTDIPVGSSGGLSNINSTWKPMNYADSPTIAVFELTETASGETIYMRVDVTAVGGVLANTAISKGLGIFQTTNSQGLTDSGSFSIYISPQNNTGTSGSAWTIDLQVSFFSSYAAGLDGAVGTFTDPRTTQLIFTTLDLDNKQQYFTSDASFGEHHKGSEITNTTASTGYTGFTSTGNTDASYDDVRYAVSSVMDTGVDSFDIRLGSAGAALYMFELRNPPNVNPMPDPVPEPGLMALAGVGGAALLVQRLRRRRA